MGWSPTAVREMADRDYQLLQRYAEQEPFGPWRTNHDIAQMASALFNLWRGKNEPRSVDAFMYKPARVYAAEHRGSILAFFRGAARPRESKKRKKRKSG